MWLINYHTLVLHNVLHIPSIQRKFVRECTSNSEAKHSVYREWIGESLDEVWFTIMEVDESVDYQTKCKGFATIETSVGVHDDTEVPQDALDEQTKALEVMNSD